MTKTIVRLRYSFILLLFPLALFAEELFQEADLLFQEGLRLRQENRYAPALAKWNLCVQKYPEYSKTYSGLVELNFFLGKFDETLKYGKKAIQDNPNDVDLYYYIGAAFSYLGNSQEALRILKKGVKLAPRRQDLLFKIGEVESAQGNFQAAEKIYKTILKYYPKEAQAAYAIGMGWGERGNKKKAREWFSKTIKRNPSFVPGLFSLALLDLEKGDDESAESKLKEVVRLQHVHPRAFFYLALLAEKKGEPLKQYYWLERARLYFQRDSMELAKILKSQYQIEALFQLSAPQMKAFSQIDLPIQLGMTKEEVEARLGKPSYQHPSGTLADYAGHALTVHYQEDRIKQIDINEGYAGWVHGLKLGEKKDEIFSIYGQPSSQKPSLLKYEFKNERVTFVVKEDKINQIYLNVPK